MTDFIAGKLDKSGVSEPPPTLFEKSQAARNTPLEFSLEAKAVFDAGRALWKYYHTCIYSVPLWSNEVVLVNASLYDIREYFQGRNDKGKMNNKSTDEQYMELITSLRNTLKALAKKIEPKVYEYGFLKA